jgi:hypothetical protein
MKRHVNKVHNFDHYLAWVLLYGCVFAPERFFLGGFGIYFGTTNGLFRRLFKNFLR